MKKIINKNEEKILEALNELRDDIKKLKKEIEYIEIFIGFMLGLLIAILFKIL